jgi:hypothetical protein
MTASEEDRGLKMAEEFSPKKLKVSEEDEIFKDMTGESSR